MDTGCRVVSKNIIRLKFGVLEILHSCRLNHKSVSTSALGAIPGIIFLHFLEIEHVIFALGIETSELDGSGFLIGDTSSARSAYIAAAVIFQMETKDSGVSDFGCSDALVAVVRKGRK